ncbi:MAG: hypothetical protein V3V18_04535 [Methylococcales bacterium]
MVNLHTTAFCILITLSLVHYSVTADSSSTESEEKISGIGGTGQQNPRRPISEELNVPETTEIPEVPHTPEIPDLDLPEATPTGDTDLPEIPE